MKIIGAVRSQCAFALAAVGVVLSLMGSSHAQEEKLPPRAKVVRLEVRPTSIHLKTPFEYKQILLTAQLDSGELVDVTRMAKVQVPSLVSVSPRGLVRPRAEGVGQLKFAFADQTVSLPVQVNGLKEKYQVSFVRDVMPTMSRMGCNAGTCHGAQKGKNGFKLSLRGYDPLFDHRALTDDLGGRRFNRSAPDQSLMLLKPSGAVAHVGGALMQPGEPYYELLRAWIADGVKLDLATPRVAKIEINPKAPTLPLPGVKQQMAVIATYNDGSTRDITAEAFVESSNTEVATADKQGLITAVRRGEATVMARYEGSYDATTMIVMGDRSGFVWQKTPEYNYIDTLVYEKLKQVKIQASGVCTDAEFIRRIYLDLTGLPPQIGEVREFLADARPQRVKRDELVDKLIGSPDYVEHRTNKWADLLQVNRKFLGEEGATALRKWIRSAVADNMPYDKFVHTVLTASGSNFSNPPASYYKVLREPGPTMENTTQLFLAVRFNCNKCHDHPFERWTQDQYYHLAAFFAQIGRAEDPKFKNKKVGGTLVEAALPLVEVISDVGTGEVKHDRTGAITPPTFPYKVKASIPANASRRAQLADWIATKENPYFAKSYVNRVWSYLLGVGIIEPVDDIRAGNPPTNPKLLEKLTEEFVNSGFNVRQLERSICKSRVYQHSITTNKWNADDEINYSHALARRLPAEVLYDSIQRATGSLSRLPGLPVGARAAQLIDSNVEIPSGFLDLFGKPPRESACECERSGSMMLGPVLNLVNGPIIADAIKDPENKIAKLVAGTKDDATVVKELFLLILCREPTPAELAAGIQAINGSGDVYQRLSGEYAKVLEGMAAYEKQIPAKEVAWEKRYQHLPTWTVLQPVSAHSAGKATLRLLSDQSVLASGMNATPEVYTVTANTKLTGITALRLEVITDASLPGGGPGRAPGGNFVLNEFKVLVAPQGDLSKAKPVIFHKAIADYAQPSWNPEGAIDGNPQTGWAIAPAFAKTHTAIFETKEPIAAKPGTTLVVILDQQFPAKLHNIGRFRLSVTTTKPPILLESGIPDTIVKILAVPSSKRDAGQQAQILAYYRTLDEELGRLRQQLADQPRPPADKRQVGAQDLAWALLNSPGFLFNH